MITCAVFAIIHLNLQNLFFAQSHMYHFMLVQVIFKLRIFYTALYCTFDQNGVSSKVPTSCFIVNTWCCSLSSAEIGSKCHFGLIFFLFAEYLLCEFFQGILCWTPNWPSCCVNKVKKARNFIAVLVSTMFGLFGNIFGLLRESCLFEIFQF